MKVVIGKEDDEKVSNISTHEHTLNAPAKVYSQRVAYRQSNEKITT